jgi:hypothetical protein
MGKAIPLGERAGFQVGVSAFNLFRPRLLPRRSLEGSGTDQTMDRIEKRIASRWLLPGAMLAGLLSPLSGQTDRELPVHRIPNLGQGAEFYFAPDSKRIIGNAKRDGDSSYHVYTLNIDGTDIRRINDRGEDACSFFFPDGQRLLWTSTRDHPELPKGNYSAPEDYPQGAELYTSKLDGSDVRRLTNNTVYDAEASVSPDCPGSA